jgi:GT2 family glycosyltransferase
MLAAVVLSKDRPDLFRACADSVPRTPFLEYRLLVDNDTEPGETAREAESHPGWAVLRGGPHVSFSLGNNQAEKWLPDSVTHLLLLNNDCVLSPGCLEALWAARDTADVVGSFILSPDGRVNHAGVTFSPSGWPDHVGRGADPDRFTGDVTRVVAVTFACVLVRRDLWRRLGGLDEKYWYCFEDIDFCLRAREAGASVRVVRAAEVVHAESSTRGPETVGRNANRYRATWVLSGRVWGCFCERGPA